MVIAYEHLHIPFEESIAFLTARGYRWTKGDWDVIAVKWDEYCQLLARPVAPS
jgi:hypothetical protein